MSFDLALDPSQLLPILIFFSYVLILSLTLLNEGMAWERKWYLALYCGLAALAMLSMVVDAVPFLRTALSSWALARLSAWAMSAWPVAFYFLTLAYLGWDLQRSLSWVLGGIWLVMVTLLSLPVGLLRIEMLTRPGFLLHMAMVSWALALPRPEAEAEIKALGGKAGSDVTRKTSYVVVGADPGSKLAKAEKFGIKTLSEAEFLELLNQDTGES